MPFAHLSQRLFNTPVAIKSDKAEVIIAALAQRLGIANVNGIATAELELAQMMAPTTTQGTESKEGYDIIGGVAMIEVKGTLIKKTSTLRPYSGMTGYNAIRQNFLTALFDPSVKAIMLDIDSPGGEVAGCFDLVDTIYNARGDKPIWSILNENAYSAAYAIASAADYITIPRTGGAGSIGVICMHVDMSAALKQDGLKVNFITYGERKTDAHSEIPLSDEAREAIQKSVDFSGGLFVETVARNRGLAPKVIKDTQARCYISTDSVELGLADAVMAPDAAFKALQKKIT